ncbi:IS5 family transposase [Salmonella enterica subsp. enterica serovar Kottbus]|nr:IS5 family transposase [Salmonella enterica subsp. enterica serovar Kottbus]EHN5889036.1 IS5 family transposase [Salmonella enterica subsp. enterica serovar Newport]
MARYDFPDEAWDIIQPLLPAQSVIPRAGRSGAEHRMSINGMFWVLCSGAPPVCKKHSDIAGDNGLGRSRGGFGTQIHLATDAGCLPLNIVLSPGQSHESQFALCLLDGIGVQRQNGSMKRRGYAMPVDTAYSGHALRNEQSVIPRKSNEKMAANGRSQHDCDACRNRNVVERCFGRLREYRRIVTRYDKTARNYLAMVEWGCIRLIYQRLCN